MRPTTMYDRHTSTKASERSRRYAHHALARQSQTNELVVMRLPVKSSLHTLFSG